MIVKRLVFVFLFLATLFGLVGTAVAQSGPQQFVVVYVEFKPANARAGGDVLQQLEARAEDSAGVIRFDVLRQIDRPNFFALFEVWSNAQTFEDFQNSSETQAILTWPTPLVEAPLLGWSGNISARPRARDSASLKAASAAQPVRPGLAVAQKFTIVFYGARIFRRKAAQSCETPRQYLCAGFTLQNRLRNITKSCAKTR